MLFRSTTLNKIGISGTSPTDVQLVYDSVKVGAGWNLYASTKLVGGGTPSAATAVTTATNYYKSTAPYS